VETVYFQQLLVFFISLYQTRRAKFFAVLFTFRPAPHTL